ncbi:MAG: hypothetical protein Q8R98_27640 [Rubrivivax sp.]|nr:hypothetical protein [Rubrivivax sp.]MDP3615630.1 hypothetical protein [Rubrivivax sp.]
MTRVPPFLVANQAILFLSDPGDTTQAMRQVLADTLRRLSVQAAQQRVVVLLDEPQLGRQFQVRVTPCILLDTGARRVQLLGKPARLDDNSLQQALTRP